jgi:lysophospholipase L1-like esterase
VVRVLSLMLGLALALPLAEGLAWGLDRGAFPYLRLFEPDAVTGVRLRAASSARVRSAHGHVTTVRTGPLGFRVPEGRQVLLLGDSQVLGYGVEDHEALAAQLAARGMDSLAAAVPSWGPAELAAEAERLVPRLSPREVLYFAYLGNDWHEAEVPNTKRSGAREGWLVTAGAAQGATRAPWAPAWLVESHLWFAGEAVGALGRGALTQPRRSAAERLLAEHPTLARAAPPYASRLSRHVARVVAACAARCRVHVVVLPLDVQVEADAWRKYAAPAGGVPDLAPLALLVHQLETDGLPLIDATPALQRAAPGVYLADDVHLSARGHAALAELLHARLSSSTDITRAAAMRAPQAAAATLTTTTEETAR